jgi:hypothetical protein
MASVFHRSALPPAHFWFPCQCVAGCTSASAARTADWGSPTTEQARNGEPAKRFISPRFNATALRKAGEVRWINPGKAISMLFMNGRLPVYVDAKGTIATLSCS